MMGFFEITVVPFVGIESDKIRYCLGRRGKVGAAAEGSAQKNIAPPLLAYHFILSCFFMNQEQGAMFQSPRQSIYFVEYIGILHAIPGKAGWDGAIKSYIRNKIRLIWPFNPSFSGYSIGEIGRDLLVRKTRYLYNSQTERRFT
jgi:hypothetical protein